MRRYRTEREPEPWVEQLIHNYGKEQRDLGVRAHVVGVRLRVPTCLFPVSTNTVLGSQLHQSPLLLSATPMSVT